MKSNRELRALRAAALKDAKALSDKGERLSPADKRTFDSLMAEAAELKTQIESLESRGGAPPNGRPDGDQRETTREQEHRSAFINYLRLGVNGMPQEQRDLLQTEYRDMGSAGEGAYPGATAGFFVPVGFVDKIIEAMKYYGPFLDPGVCEMMDTLTGAPLPYPTDNDVLVFGQRIGEGQQVAEADVQLGQILFGAWKYTSNVVKVSIELVQDSAFDFESYLARKFAQRIGRALVQDFTNGTGSAQSQPLGLVTAVQQSGNFITALGAGSNDSVSLPNSIGTDDLTNLEHAIDVLYRPGASYMAHDSVWQAIRKVKDKFGNPIWQKSLVAGMPDTINGHGMLVNNFMSPLQVSPSSPPVTVTSMVFGDLKRYIVRRVRDLSCLVLRERWADYGQIGYLCFARYDGQPAYGATGGSFPFAGLRNTY